MKKSVSQLTKELNQAIKKIEELDFELNRLSANDIKASFALKENDDLKSRNSALLQQNEKLQIENKDLNEQVHNKVEEILLKSNKIELKSIPQCIDEINTSTSCILGSFRSVNCVNDFLNPNVVILDIIDESEQISGIVGQLNFLNNRLKKIDEFSRSIQQQLYLNSGYSQK